MIEEVWIQDEVRINKRSRLPHWYVGRGLYFVTFRVADALPASCVQQLDADRRALLRAMTRGQLPTAQQVAILNSAYRKQLETYLDAGYGSCPFRNSNVAAVVADSFRHFDTVRYRLLSWCIMPNHVHILFRLKQGFELPTVVQSWKSFTSRRINTILSNHGEFWQKNYFDRSIRNRRQLEATIDYIVGNPAAAGLWDWPWVYTSPDAISAELA